jgi:signal transduction histidine kinase
MNFKNERIKTLLVEIRRKNNELTDKNNEILAMNEELSSLNEELSTVNETLEETVRFRTKELETQNQQLTEYAFINSHLLRAPLARILGLSDLLTREATSVKDTQLIEALYTSSKEMDIIIKKISDILYDGNNLTREDIKTIIDRNLNPLVAI